VLLGGFGRYFGMFVGCLWVCRISSVMMSVMIAVIVSVSSRVWLVMNCLVGFGNLLKLLLRFCLVVRIVGSLVFEVWLVFG